MNLAMVTDSASQIAWAIKRIMEVDVVIIDDELNRITDTFAYPRQRIEIRKNSIVGRIIETGKPLAIDDKERFQSCIECQDFENCEMKSLIGVPIIYEDKVVGAIALSVAPRFMKGLFGNLSHTIGFLEKMAEMLSGKLQTESDYQKLNLAKMQREVLIDSMDEAIVLVDKDGLITYSNTRFNDAFFLGKAVINMPVSAVIRHALIEEFLKNKQSFEDKLIYCEYKDMCFDGYCTARTIMIGGEYHGAVFMLKSINVAQNTASESGSEIYSLEKFLGTSARCRAAVSRARAACKNDETTLIDGGSDYRRLELAQAIHAGSKRSHGNFFSVDCANDSDSVLECELFGASDNLMTSKLRLSNKGTLCIRNIDRMPRFMQRRLSDYLVNHTISVSGGHEIGTDARLIFTTGENLRALAEIRMFDEGLLTLITRQVVHLPEIGDSPEDIEAYVSHNFVYYAQRYGVEDLIVQPEVTELLCRYSWPGDVRQIKNVVEYLVANAKGHTVSLDTAAPLRFLLDPEKQQEKSADQLVEEQIIRLMETGKTRDEIAEVLKISRATLFRRLKKMNAQSAQRLSG